MKFSFGKDSKRAPHAAPKAAGFSMAQFLKLNGSVWSGKTDGVRMDLPDSRPALHVPLIPTRSESATFLQYK